MCNIPKEIKRIKLGALLEDKVLKYHDKDINLPWCILTRRFWATEMCLRASKTSKMSVWLPEWASNSLKSKF